MAAVEAFSFTEPTTALRDWLRTILDDDVWAGGLPRGATTGIVLTRVGGPIVAPIDDGLYQLDCWATTAPAAAALASRVVTALAGEGRQTIDVDTGLVWCGLGAVSLLSLSDPAAPDRYRTVVTAELPTLTLTPQE
ncbi:MAG TPA: hypothetical protein VGE43_19380 [Acidimicrobiales bacterium]